MRRRLKPVLFLIIFLMMSPLLFAQGPTITQQPQNQTVLEGTTATFVITATGDASLAYQWYKNTVLIPGATSSSYTTPATVLADDSSIFYCIASDSSGTKQSNNASLFITAGQAPTITVQPVDQSVLTGQTATFSVTAGGTSPLQYQWEKNNINIPGANSSNYTTPATILSDDGAIFTCIVSNSFGSLATNTAKLFVTDANSRVSEGIQVLYKFDEGSGTTINDVSNIGAELDLTIDDLDLASWTDNGLNVHGNSRIKSQNLATKIIDACKSSNEITFEAWVLPTNLTTRNLHTRIFSISENSYTERNFGVVQHQAENYYQLRTTTTDNNGTPSSQVSAISSQLTHLAYSRKADGTVKIYRDGIEVLSETLAGDLSNWADGYRIFLGNEAASFYYWEGTYYLMAVYNRALSGFEISHNFSIGVKADEVPSFSVSPKDQFVVENEVATFSALAISVNPVSYQWRKNGVNIPGANESTLVMQATGADAGAAITCVATSTSGSQTSAPALLTVTFQNKRVTGSQQILYTFKEGSGTVINDMSNEGTPYNLSIFNSEAVNWKKDGLELISPASISSTAPASKIINSVTASNEITIEAWVKAANNTQTGPAEILTLSADANSRDFDLAQTADSFSVRVRTTSTNNNGEPGISSAPNTVNASEFDHIVYTMKSDGTTKLFLNGTERVSENQSGNFSNWDSYFLGLGNEIGGGAPWLGTVNLIAVFDRALSNSEVLVNYNFGPYGVIANPTNLTLISNEINTVSISWTDNSPNEDGFIIERGMGNPIVYTVLDSVATDSTSFIDNTVGDNIEYTYRISAFNSIGTSSYSNELKVTSLISPITAPSNLQYTYNTEGYPVLSWEDHSNNELGFIVERRTTIAGSSFSVVDSVLADVTSFTDLTVMDSTSYVYRVLAYNSNTSSEYSGEKIVDVLTAISQFDEIPTNYSLSQNYPNPFNPTTTIKFSLPQTANVNISVFNLLGQKVNEIINGNYSAGYHSVSFNADQYTSGIYIYSITANGLNGKNFSQTRKMILLK